MELLKLTALDKDDLDIISTHMQDAVARIGDLVFQRAQNRFAIIANRFDWELSELAGPDQSTFQRRQTGLHFGRVLSVKSQNIRQGNPEAVLSLLSISFEEGEAPSGNIVLTFSGGGQLKLHVECIEAQMRDLGPAWSTERQPQHEADHDQERA